MQCVSALKALSDNIPEAVVNNYKQVKITLMNILAATVLYILGVFRLLNKGNVAISEITIFTEKISENKAPDK